MKTFYSEAEFRKFYEDNKSKFYAEPTIYRSDRVAPFVIDGYTEAVKFWRVKEYIDPSTEETRYDNDVYVESGIRRIGTTDIIVPCRSFNKKTATFESFELYYKGFTDYHWRHYFKFSKPEPNGVGVATKKKLEAWFEYLAEKLQAVTEHINKGKKARQDYIDKAISLGYDFHTLTEEQAEIYTPLFKLTAEFGEGGAIYESLKYIGRQNLDAFAQMPKKLEGIAL